MLLRTTLALVLALAAAPVSASPLTVQAPMALQGQLTTAGGKAVTDDVALAFMVYDAPSGGQVLYSEIHPSVAVVDGRFAVEVGVDGLAEGGLDGLADVMGVETDLWLGVSVDGAPELPRQRLASTGLSYRATLAAAAESLTCEGCVGPEALAPACADGQSLRQQGGAWQCADAAARGGLVLNRNASFEWADSFDGWSIPHHAAAGPQPGPAASAGTTGVTFINDGVTTQLLALPAVSLSGAASVRVEAMFWREGVVDVAGGAMFVLDFVDADGAWMNAVATLAPADGVSGDDAGFVPFVSTPLLVPEGAAMVGLVELGLPGSAVGMLHLDEVRVVGDAPVLDEHFVRSDGGTMTGDLVLVDGAEVACDGCVPSAAIAPASITAGQLGAGAVGPAQLADGAVTGPKIAPDAVDTWHIRADAVTGVELAPSSVTIQHIQLGAVGAGQIGDGSVTGTKIAKDAIVGMHITEGAVTAPKLADGAVEGQHIAAGAITSTKLAPSSVGADAIAPGAVDNQHILGGAVGATQIAGGAVISGKLGSGSVGPANLKYLAVGPEHLAAGAVTSEKLAPGSVGPTAIHDGAVRLNALHSAAVGGLVVNMDPGFELGAEWVPAAGATNFGNIVTDAASGEYALRFSATAASETSLRAGGTYDLAGGGGIRIDAMVKRLNVSGSPDAPLMWLQYHDASSSPIGEPVPALTGALASGSDSGWALSRDVIVAPAGAARVQVVSLGLSGGVTGAVTVDDVYIAAAGALIHDQFLPRAGGVIDGDVELAAGASLVCDGCIGPNTLSSSAVGTSSLKSFAVTSAKIAGGAVTGAHLADGAVSYAKLGLASVKGKAIADGSITNPKLAAASVTSDKIQTMAVGASHIVHGSITGTHIADDAVTRDDLIGVEVGLRKLPQGCGAGVTSEISCKTLPCGYFPGGLLFNTCMGTCSSPTPMSCAFGGEPPVGYLLAPGQG